MSDHEAYYISWRYSLPNKCARCLQRYWTKLSEAGLCEMCEKYMRAMVIGRQGGKTRAVFLAATGVDIDADEDESK